MFKAVISSFIAEGLLKRKELLEEDTILTVTQPLTKRPTLQLPPNAYDLSLRNDISAYDAIFVSLALEAGLELKTFDEEQVEIVQGKAKS